MKKINQILLLFIISFLLWGCQTTKQKIYTDSGVNYKDTDWNATFFQSHRFPSRDSVQWVKEGDNNFLRFRLKDKDKGYASTDRIVTRRAPYMERAEVTQRIGLKTKSKYQIKFSARFVQGFENDKGEVFFQIHQENKICKIGPILKLQFNRGRLVLHVINANNSKFTHKEYFATKYLSQLKDKWNKFKVVYDAEKKIISLYLNDNFLIRNINHAENSCATPYLKFGIYRKGNKDEPNKLSVVDFDKFQITEIKTK